MARTLEEEDNFYQKKTPLYPFDPSNHPWKTFTVDLIGLLLEKPKLQCHSSNRGPAWTPMSGIMVKKALPKSYETMAGLEGLFMIETCALSQSTSQNFVNSSESNKIPPPLTTLRLMDELNGWIKWLDSTFGYSSITIRTTGRIGCRSPSSLTMILLTPLTNKLHSFLITDNTRGEVTTWEERLETRPLEISWQK